MVVERYRNMVDQFISSFSCSRRSLCLIFRHSSVCASHSLHDSLQFRELKRCLNLFAIFPIIFSVDGFLVA